MRKNRKGMASVELLLVTGSFVLATFMFWQLGETVIERFFVDGNQVLNFPWI